MQDIVPRCTQALSEVLIPPDAAAENIGQTPTDGATNSLPPMPALFPSSSAEPLRPLGEMLAAPLNAPIPFGTPPFLQSGEPSPAPFPPTSADPEQGDAFLAEVAHKMRNRLNAIHGFIELVTSGHVGRITARQRKMLSYAHNSSIDLMEYIENLLYLMRAEQDQVTYTLGPFALAELLEEITQFIQIEIAAGQIAFTIDCPADLPLVQGDRTRLRQALMNLATNAVKFTPPGGTVTYRAHADATMVILTLTDTGLGIAPDDLPHIFTREYQSERMALLGLSGGGLGLAAAKAIITFHAGTINVSSAIDHGTTFTIRLPIALDTQDASDRSTDDDSTRCSADGH